MSIAIDFTDANSDGRGINFASYMKSFDKNFEASDYGGFTNQKQSGIAIPNGGYVVKGDDYVSWDGHDNGQSVIFEGGAKGWSYSFDGDDGKYGTDDDHTLSGDLTAIAFGKGTSDQPDYSNNGEIRISFEELEIADYSSSWISDLSDDGVRHNTASLMKFLNSDSVAFNGSSGKDVFTGFSKADTLHGEGGADTLGGGKGNDVIYGDEGNDRLAGGTGSDTFVFQAGDGNDRITDFGTGADVIDFSGQFASFEAIVDAATDGKNGVTINYEGGSLTILGFDIAHLTESQLLFA